MLTVFKTFHLLLMCQLTFSHSGPTLPPPVHVRIASRGRVVFISEEVRNWHTKPTQDARGSHHAHARKKNERMHVIYIKIEAYCNSAKHAYSTCAYHKGMIYIKGYMLISLYDIATPSLSDGSSTMVLFLTHSCHSVCSCRLCLSLLLFAPSSFIYPVTTTGTCTVAYNFARPLVLCVES